MAVSLAQQLSFLSRHKLAQILDQDNIRGCDWRALVEQMGFTYEMILFLRDKKSPTMSLLEEWEMKEGSGASIDQLIDMVELIENVPALELLKEVRVKLSLRPMPISPRLSPSPHQSPIPSRRHSSDLLTSDTGKGSIGSGNFAIGTPPPSYEQVHTKDQSNSSLKEFNQRLQNEVTHSLTSLSVKDDGDTYLDDDDVMKNQSLSEMDKSLLEGNEFDIFLSFASADSDFAEEMRLRLEHKAKISCYIPSEGLMPGQSFQDEIADKIKRGCRKTVIIMSPEYIDSPWCTYEARLAHHKNPDPRRHVLIPVMYAKCKVPDFISYLYYLDYPRYKDDPHRCERYFWERLYKAIQLPQR